ncbi:MAG: M23/M56 family metallopeptidase [Rhodothermales bacterium]
MNPTFVTVAGEALLHSLWQGAFIAGALALALRLMRGASPNARYLVSWAALTAMVALPVWTAWPSGSGGTDGLGGAELLTPARSSDHIVPQVLPDQMAQSAATGFAVSPLLVALWLIGVLVMSFRLALGWREVHRMRRLPGRPLDAGLAEAVDRLMRSLGITHRVRILATDRAGEPMLIGWLKPVIMIPAALLAGMPPAHVEAILAHELAHIRRHDYLFAVLQSILEAVLFYHPAAWWISGRIREERERACDDLAVAAIASRSTYVRALAGLEERRVASLRLALPAGGGSLVGRIQRLVEPPAPDRLRSASGIVLAIAIVAVSSFIAVACIDAREAPGVTSSTVIHDALGFQINLPENWQAGSFNEIDGAFWSQLYWAPDHQQFVQIEEYSDLPDYQRREWFTGSDLRRIARFDAIHRTSLTQLGLDAYDASAFTFRDDSTNGYAIWIEAMERYYLVTAGGMTSHVDDLTLRKTIGSLNFIERQPLVIDIPSLHPLGDTTRVVSGFGMRFHPVLKIERFHRGVDFAAPAGKPVYATADGIVKSAETAEGYGQIIRIAHEEGYETWYAQLSQQRVAQGDTVRAGQQIGAAGSSGLSTAPHLHYEVHKNGKPVDPIDYLP